MGSMQNLIRHLKPNQTKTVVLPTYLTKIPNTMLYDKGSCYSHFLYHKPQNLHVILLISGKKILVFILVNDLNLIIIYQ